MSYPEAFLKFTHENREVEYLPAHNLSTYSTFKTKTICDLVIVKSIKALQELLPLANKFNLKYKLLGWGANQVLREMQGFYLKLEFPFERESLSVFQDKYTIPASASLANLTSAASKLKLKQWEVFTGIPSSFGGALFMNAGTSLGEIGSLMESFEYVDKQGKLIKHTVNNQTFSYRKNNIVKEGEVIVGGVIKTFGQDDGIPQLISNYLKMRNSSQPMSKNTCGCVFKNFSYQDGTMISAGQLLDLLNLKGFGVKGIRISPIHANFFEHDGTLSDWEVISFLEKVKSIVQLYTGIELEFEVQI